MPAPVRLDDMVAIAEEEGMKPGYTIAFPENTTDEAGNPLFGSYAMYNSWPRKTSEARDVFVDQFTGETLAEQSVYGSTVPSPSAWTRSSALTWAPSSGCSRESS